MSSYCSVLWKRSGGELYENASDYRFDITKCSILNDSICLQSPLLRARSWTAVWARSAGWTRTTWRPASASSSVPRVSSLSAGRTVWPTTTTVSGWVLSASSRPRSSWSRQEPVWRTPVRMWSVPPTKSAWLHLMEPQLDVPARAPVPSLISLQL